MNERLNHRNHQARNIAFTLIELLVVMALIVILAAIVIGAGGYAIRAATEARMKAEIRAMETALEAYKSDHGGYPPLDADLFNVANVPTNFTSASSHSASITTGAWLNTAFLYRALGGVGPGNTKRYMSFASNMVVTGFFVNGSTTNFVGRLIKNPLGKPYGYNPVAPVANQQSMDLFSSGLDNQTGYPTNLTTSVNRDDISNWQK